jgi:predicted Fe-S protein YdhL (DUF1289 family)
MQQLSFLEAPPLQDAVPVWNALDEEQRRALVMKLARLMARTIAQTMARTKGEHEHERTE